MLKKPFDRVVGETRQCRECGDEFHTHKPIWVCKPCFNKKQRKYNSSKWVKKDPYPFSNKSSQASNRFGKIRTKLNKAWRKGPDAVKEHYNAQLKEIEENGILAWIYDRRDTNTKREGMVKTRNRTTKEFPDTRGYYEE